MRKWKKKYMSYILAIAALLIIIIACRNKGEAKIEPSIAVEVKLNQNRIPINSPLEMSYSWKVVRRDKKLDKDYKVFVHFLDKNGHMFLNDDHFPPIKTTHWSSDKPVEYERTIFFSNISILGKGSIKVGFYEPNEEMKRLRLIGEDEGNDMAYKIADIEIVGEELDKEPIFKDGWYEPEYTTRGSRVVEWSWTKKEAEVAFLNPNTDAVLYLSAHSPAQELEGGQKVILELNDRVIDSFIVTSPEDFLEKIRIEQSLWGGKKWANLKIKVDKTFIPSADGIQGDIRELGIRVYHLFLYY